MRPQLDGIPFFFTPARNHDDFIPHFMGVLNRHMAQAASTENSHLVARSGVRLTQCSERGGACAEDWGGIDRGQRRRNGYECGVANDHIFSVASVTAKPRRQLVFAEMKKPVATGFTGLAVTAQTAHAHPLIGVPDIRNRIAFLRNTPHNFMSGNTRRLALCGWHLRIPQIGPAYATGLNFDENFICRWYRYRSYYHLQHARRRDLHSTKGFVHGISCETVTSRFLDCEGNEETRHHIVSRDGRNGVYGLCFTRSALQPFRPAITPPSISQMAPVTQPVLSESRKATVSAISTGVPTRPIGWKLSKLFMTSFTSSFGMKPS